MRAVNLLPKDLQNAKSIRHEDPAVVVGSALAVIVMITLCAAFLSAHGKANTQQAALTKARLELAQLAAHHRAPTPVKPSAPITPIVPPPAVTGEEATWLSAVSTSLSQRIAWDRVLREVSLVVPSDVTLTQLTMTAPTPTSEAAAATPGAQAAQGFVIAGNAFSYDSVARLLSRLSLVPDLSNVTLASTGSAAAGSSGSSGSSSPPPSSGSGVTFNITAAVAGPPAAPPPVVPVAPPTDTTTGA